MNDEHHQQNLAGLRATALATGLTVPAMNSAIAADKIVIYTNWFAEPEHGGIWQAKAAGIFEKYGIDADVRQGGPQVNTSLILLGGKADFVMLHNSAEMFSAVKEHAPLVAVASYYQKDPQAILTHKGEGKDLLGSLKGSPIILSQDALNSWWPWLKSKYGYTDDQIRRQFPDGGIPQQQEVGAAGLHHHRAGHGSQGRYGSETFSCSPIMAGIPTGAPRDPAGNHRPETRPREAHDAGDAPEGPDSYYQNGAIGNALIKQTAPNNTDELITNILDEMKKNGIVLSGEALTLGASGQ